MRALAPRSAMHDLAGGDSARREPRGIELDVELARRPSDHHGLGHVGDGADLLLELDRHPAQIVGAVTRAVQGERQDRDVVDGVRLDQRRRRTRRRAVHRREQLGVDLDDALFLVRAHA